MPKRVHLPDGRIVNFPDSMGAPEIQAAMRKLAGSAPATPPAQEPAPGVLAKAGQMASDVVGGLRSSVARTVYGGGDLIRQGLGMERVIDRPEVQAAMTAPDSGTGRATSLGADVAQFFTPTGAVGKFKTAAEIAKSGALTLAQTGSPTAAGASAALAGVLPGAGAAARLAPKAQAAAEKTVAQALGATKEWAKNTASKIAPEMLSRGVKGSRATMLVQASRQTSAVGQQIGAEIQAAAQAGTTISGTGVRGAIQQAAGALHVADAAGTTIPIAGTEAVVTRLAKLDDFVAKLGPDIPIDKAAKIKTTFDQIVSKAGLYGPKAAASATDSANAWAIREAATGFRTLLAKASPTLEDLNKEYAFWKGLKGVLTETAARTQAQSGGLASAVTGAAGMAAGAASGDTVSDQVQNAVLGGLAGRHLVRFMQSPQWRTRVSGPTKAMLARALASGNADQVTAMINRIGASMPGQLSSATGQSQ